MAELQGLGQTPRPDQEVTVPQDSTTPTLTIDPQLAGLLPDLTPEEYEQLRESIAAEGCREPLTVWAGRGIIVDGHNRYRICREHGITFDVREFDFADVDAVMDWIDRNQLARRNLTPDAFRLALGRRYNRVKKADGQRGPKKLAQNEPASTADRLAAEHGVSRETVKRAGKFAEEVEAQPQLQEAIRTRKPVVQAKREMKERAREERRADNRETVEAFEQVMGALQPAHQFATIVLDPPWDWDDEGDCDQMGRARPTYSTMPFSDVERLPVADFADKDCHLYLWITNRSLPKGFALLDAWGFRYITCLTWCKPSIGMGNYFRGSTEQILFGVKGSQPLNRKDVGTWFAAPRGPGGHSSKPAEFFDLVRSCSPGPYLEMLARGEREGWSVWGAEA